MVFYHKLQHFSIDIYKKYDFVKKLVHYCQIIIKEGEKNSNFVHSYITHFTRFLRHLGAEYPKRRKNVSVLPSAQAPERALLCSLKEAFSRECDTAKI